MCIFVLDWKQSFNVTSCIHIFVISHPSLPVCRVIMPCGARLLLPELYMNMSVVATVVDQNTDKIFDFEFKIT